MRPAPLMLEHHATLSDGLAGRCVATTCRIRRPRATTRPHAGISRLGRCTGRGRVWRFLRDAGPTPGGSPGHCASQRRCGSRRHAYRSRMGGELAPRPIISAEARSTPTERPTRRGRALTANGIDCGASFPQRRLLLCPARAGLRGQEEGASDGFLRSRTTEASSVKTAGGHGLALRSGASRYARDGNHVAPRRR